MYEPCALVIASPRRSDCETVQRDVSRKNTEGWGRESTFPSLSLSFSPLIFSRLLTPLHTPLADHLEQAPLVMPFRNKCETMSSPSFFRGACSFISLAQLSLWKIKT